MNNLFLISKMDASVAADTWNTATEERVRLHHFKLPCWFAWADPPENFDDKLEKILLEDMLRMFLVLKQVCMQMLVLQIGL